MADYFPDVAWSTISRNVVPYRTGGTVFVLNTYVIDIYPINANEPGASTMEVAVNDYFIDYLGYPYTILNVATVSTYKQIRVYDINERSISESINYGPYPNQIGYVYRPINGAVILSQAQLLNLDSQARDRINNIEKGIIWENRGIRMMDSNDYSISSITELHPGENMSVTISHISGWNGGEVASLGVYIDGDMDKFLLSGDSPVIANSGIGFSTLNTLADASDTLISSTLAIKTYVDNTASGGSFLDSVIRMVINNSFDPGASPTAGDRYIAETITLHANFGTIAGLGLHDIIEYSGSAFTVVFDASAASTPATVTVGTDKNGATNHQWTYNTASDEWVDRGAITNHNDTGNKQGGTTDEYYHLTATQHTDLTDSGNSTLHYHASDRSRANHTGSQAYTTITDFIETVQDTVATQIQPSASSYLTWTYNDAAGTLTPTVSISGINYWTKTGNDLSYTTGNVSIGGVPSAYKLDVTGLVKLGTLNGYIKGASGVLSAVTSIPITDITGTRAQYDASASDGNFMWIGDAPTSHVLDSASHTISGKTAGQLLLATAATTYAFTSMTGQASITGGGVITLDNGSVIGKVLTGYTATNGTIAATDTLLQAIQKLGYDKHVAVTLATNHGLGLSGQVLSMGTPSEVTGTSTNSVTTTTHTHALTTGYGDNSNPYASKTAKYFLAAPNASAGVPSFRAIVASDIPTLNQNTSGSAGSVTNSVTFNTTGGAVAGTTYNGSAARTIDYSTVGASSSSHIHGSITNTGTFTSGGTLNFNSTGAATATLFGDSTGAYTAKTINIGGGGIDLSTTFISLGSSIAGAATTYTLNGLGSGFVKSSATGVLSSVNYTTLSQYGITDAQPLDDDLTALAGLSAIPASGFIKKTGTHTISIDTATYQPLDTDLTNIAALGFASTSFLKKTALNTWALDTNAYVYTKAGIEGLLTGTITTHAHNQIDIVPDGYTTITTAWDLSADENVYASISSPLSTTLSNVTSGATGIFIVNVTSATTLTLVHSGYTFYIDNGATTNGTARQLSLGIGRHILTFTAYGSSGSGSIFVNYASYKTFI